MTRSERAEELFFEGYTCAQSVVLAFADLTGVDRAVLERLSAPFGGGMGAGSSCGGLGGKAGPHTSRVIGVIVIVVAIRIDITEVIVVVVIRGTKPPPHRQQAHYQLHT